MNIKPGDLFEFVYEHSNSFVHKDEELWSDMMKKYVPCSGVCLCIGINQNDIHWVSNRGLFNVRPPQAFHFSRALRAWSLVVPRKINHEH